MITQHEMEEWFRDPVTQQFLEGLRVKREEVKESWAKQVYFDETNPTRSDRLNLYALASIDVLGQVIDLVEENRPQQREVG